MEVKLEIGLEIFWPKSNNPSVYIVVECWEHSTKVVLLGDWGDKKAWCKEELIDAIRLGYAQPYTNGVPRKARLKLNWVDGEWGDFQTMFGAEIEGRKVYIAKTRYIGKLVGVSDENGRLIRKRSITERAREMISGGEVVNTDFDLDDL